MISAVGHQTDFTIADYVADLRAPTPSAAAELAVFDYRQAMQELLGMRQQMDKELQRKVTVARNHLEHQRMRLHYLSPQQRMNENRRRVAEYEEKLTGRMEELLRERRHRLALLAGTLESYSPVKKLSGGYAFVEDGNHQALRSIHQIRKKDTVQIHLLDGTLTAAVTEIQAAEGVKMSDELEKKEPGLEERFAKIDAILDAMEDENVTLDRSFALYKEGLEQIKAAGQSLDTIEKAMLVLNQDGKLEEF